MAKAKNSTSEVIKKRQVLLLRIAVERVEGEADEYSQFRISSCSSKMKPRLDQKSDQGVGYEENINFQLRLLSSIDHELRTPLNTALYMTKQILTSKLLDASQTEDFVLPLY